MVNYLEFVISLGIVLDICLVMFATAKFANLVYKVRLRNELGMKAFDYTKSSKRIEYDKKTLEVLIYLLGIAGALLIAAAGFLSETLSNYYLILYSGMGLMLFTGFLFGYLKFSKRT